MDTIVAPASASVSQAVGIVRISGTDAWSIGKKLVKNKKLPDSGSFSYCEIIDPENDELIDSGIILVFKSPRSFTGEDSIEIQVHGSPPILGRITKCAVSLGARKANAGEFSYRAFLNGKQSVTQLELGNALSHLKNNQTNQGIGKTVDSIRDQLGLIISNIEASISYQNDVSMIDTNSMLSVLSSEIRLVLDSSSKHGHPSVVIAGPPNAGKSTLFNHLVGFDRTVVSNKSGTTRDFVKIETKVMGRTIKLVDGPGLDLDSPDSGQALVRKVMSVADIVLWLDPKALNINESEQYILIQSISDQPHNVSDGWIQLSVKQSIGLDDLVHAITSKLKHHKYTVTNRQYDILQKINRFIDSAMEAENLDMKAYDLGDAMKLVSHLDGINLSTETIKNIFSTFCVGK